MAGFPPTQVGGLFLYCAYVLAYLVAKVDDDPAIVWPSILTGAALGGLAAGFLWPAQVRLAPPSWIPRLLSASSPPPLRLLSFCPSSLMPPLPHASSPLWRPPPFLVAALPVPSLLLSLGPPLLPPHPARPIAINSLTISPALLRSSLSLRS